MQDRELHDDIDQLLRELDRRQQQNQQAHTTDDIPHMETNQEYDPNRQQWEVEVHFYPKEEPEEPAIVVESIPPLDQEPESGGRRPFPWVKRAHTRPLVLVSLILCACALVVVCLLSMLHFWTATTTVTLVPVTHTLETRLLVTIGGSTDTAQSQVPGRFLPTVTMSQARTIATTGKAHQDAQSAHGYITFYNTATYPQMVPAQTLLTDTNGVQIVTDQDASIPAGTLATNGRATVTAHAVQSGPVGNIPASDIYGPCCRANVLAANTAFSGGQDARDYQSVTQHDLDTAGASLKASIEQSTTAALPNAGQEHRNACDPLALSAKD